MRLSSAISFIFLLQCLSALQPVYGKNDKTTGKRGETQPFSRAGKLSTKHKHECSWEIFGDATVGFTIACNVPGSTGYNCTYEGEPQKCPLYATKAKQYWKQILGKLRKMKNVCEDKTLRSRLCKKTEAVESQLVRLGEEIVADKVKAKNRNKESAKEPEERAKNPEGNENLGAEKKSKKKKSDAKPDQKPHPSPSGVEFTTIREVNDDIVEINENLAETYCAEKWHSVCSFFVNFWNG